jgi:hypothetical protein
VIELSTQNVVSGTSRLFYALLIAVQLGFGIAIGANFAMWLSPVNQTCISGFSPWYNLLFFPLTGTKMKPLNVIIISII